MDSSSVHAILQADDRTRSSPARLVVIRGPANIDRLFALTGVEGRLELLDPLEPSASAWLEDVAPPARADPLPARVAEEARFQLQTVASGGRRTLVLTGEVDLQAATVMEEAARRLCVGGVSELVLDLGKVTFMDSMGLRATVSVHELCRANRYDFCIIPGPSQIQALFDMTGLADVLPFQVERDRPRLVGDALLPRLFVPSAWQSEG